MSLLDEITAGRKLLKKNTATVITNPDGKRFLQTSSGLQELQSTGHGFVVDTKPDDVPASITGQLYLGSQDCCTPETLQSHKITHVLSVGIDCPFKSPSLSHKFVECLDLPETDIKPVVAVSIEFIDEAVFNGGVVLVHCNAGVSRSASVVVGYLMARLGMGYEEALEHVRKSRPCARPNDGFAVQLKQFNLS